MSSQSQNRFKQNNTKLVTGDSIEIGEEVGRRVGNIQLPAPVYQECQLQNKFKQKNTKLLVNDSMEICEEGGR